MKTDQRRTTAGKTLLLRSSWQTVNIGDIAHTPGVLALFEKHLPDTGVILWPSDLGRGVAAMLRKRFPKLRIVRDGAWKNPTPRADDPTVEEAFREAKLLVHGSGPSLVAQGDVERWRDATGKPYGVFGVTLGNRIGAVDQKPELPDGLRRVLDGAAFVYTRETQSLDFLRRAGVHPPVLDFTPDGTFALDLKDEAAADKLLRQSDLEPEHFVCAVPRLRITPYWDIHPERKWDPEDRAAKTALNARFAESDHAKLREAIVRWVRETGDKVLVCAEMTYEVDLIRPLVVDPLPDDVKKRVVGMDRYWLTDEAASVYRRARAVLSMECHSPIMANAGGRPGFYLRQPTDTWKGQMYPDLGLGAWKFEVETATGREIADALMNVQGHYDDALKIARTASRAASERYQRAMKVIGGLLDA